MKIFLLIFTTSVIILISSFYFGFDQIEKSYEVSGNVSLLAQPIKDRIDLAFLEGINLPNE